MGYRCVAYTSRPPGASYPNLIKPTLICYTGATPVLPTIARTYPAIYVTRASARTGWWRRWQRDDTMTTARITANPYHELVEGACATLRDALEAEGLTLE